MTEVVLALGSNLGDRMEHLRDGVRGLGSVVRIEAASSVVEVPAREVDAGPAQGAYLNAVIRGRTGLEPRPLLDACLAVESDAGRERSYRKAPRTLDVDIVFYGNRTVRTPGLTIPHARWKTRDFVVVPLLEVAPDHVDPETGRTVREVAREGGFEGEGAEEVRRVAGPDALIEPE